MQPTLLLYKKAIQPHIFHYFLFPDMYLCQLQLALRCPEMWPGPIYFLNILATPTPPIFYHNLVKMFNRKKKSIHENNYKHSNADK